MTTGAFRLSDDGKQLTVRIPMRFARRGGRKLVITPAGNEPWVPHRPHFDNVLIRALARAHRWQKLIESGGFASLRELAKAEGVNHGYISRLLKLTLLAPDIVEAILDGKQPRLLQLDNLRKAVPSDWFQQRELLAQ
jgi:hypothetical protein